MPYYYILILQVITIAGEGVALPKRELFSKQYIWVALFWKV